MNGVASFPLAPMSRLVVILTVALLALPGVFLAAAAFGQTVLLVPALLVIAVYAWVWLRFRPQRFDVGPDALEIVWPLKRARIDRARITGVRLLDRRDLAREVGWCMRVGAGGLWGAFGWLWTRRRGIVQMYISRTDRFVWIERAGERPWMITPDGPEAFVRAIASGLPAAEGRSS